MSQLNVNNTDDLFRRASEEYPLRTDSADWDRLSAALEKDPSMIVPPSNENEDGRRRKRFFWLFLLLPLGGLGYYAWHTGSYPAAIAAEKPAGKTASPATAAIGTTNANATTTGQPATASHPATTAQQETATSGTQKTTDQNTAPKPNTAPDNTAGTPANPGQHIANPRQLIADQGTGTSQDRVTMNHGRTTAKHGKTPARSGQTTADNNSDMITPAPDQAITAQAATVPDKNNNTTNPHPPLTTTTGKDIALGKDATTQKTSTNPKDTAYRKNTILAKTDSAAKTPAATVARVKQKNKSGRYFYAGVLIAPDLSTVKFQSVKGMGYTTGILLGYSLSKRWSIETGAYLDMKKYYSEGQYFSKSKVPALQALDVKNVDGSCNMIEIPLNARYNLNTSEKRKWFVTSGLTTYLMYQETYNFQFMSSSGYPWNKSYTYRNPSQSWFSQISLSMGYEEKLGKIGNLRLEPYLRIPLAGIGTGSLPITSAGLNIGLTHSFR